MNFFQFFSSLELGLVFSLVAIGVFLSFRVINFADLTVDGSFTLGAAVMATLLLKEYSLLFAFITATTSGMLAGAVTGILNTRFKIMEILASILTMSALYSINMRIMGRPNLSLMSLDLPENYGFLIVAGTTSLISMIIILFLKTQIGLAMRSTGQNPQLSSSCGVNTGVMRILALSISNGLIALSGALFTITQSFADISMGVGTIIIGLASVIIGEAIFSNKSTHISLIAVVIGAIIYRLLVTLALNAEFLELAPSDLNLISTGLVIIVMIAPTYCSKWFKR
jgi:putative ABC transport system permease protein